jgi:hypothetical protein
MTQSFAKNWGSRENVIVSLIEISSPSASQFRPNGTPFICLVLGPRRKYWPTTHERGEETWRKFIEDHTSREVVSISEDPEWSRSGGSLFHLDVKEEKSPLLMELTNISCMYRVFECKFTYRVRADISEDTLTVHRSKKCQIIYNKAEPLLAFVEAYKFSFLHKYDLDEITEVRSKRSLLLMIVMHDLSDIQSTALQNLGKGPDCKALTVGWASNRESQETVRALDLKYADLPAVIHFTPLQNCMSFYVGDPLKIEDSGFFVKIKTGLCNRTFNASEQNQLMSQNEGNADLINSKQLEQESQASDEENKKKGEEDAVANHENNHKQDHEIASGEKKGRNENSQRSQMNGTGWAFIFAYCGIAGFLIFMLRWGSGSQHDLYNRIEDEV